jgi:hypothetical protein
MRGRLIGMFIEYRSIMDNEYKRNQFLEICRLCKERDFLSTLNPRRVVSRCRQERFDTPLHCTHKLKPRHSVLSCPNNSTSPSPTGQQTYYQSIILHPLKKFYPTSGAVIIYRGNSILVVASDMLKYGMKQHCRRAVISAGLLVSIALCSTDTLFSG